MPRRALLRFASAEQAQAAFYQAFEQADPLAMMQVWAEDEEVICVHPGGERLVGTEAVRESWRALFQAGPQMHFEIAQVHTLAGRTSAVYNLCERIRVDGDLRVHAVLATNVYLLTPGGWRMVMHHASPLPQGAEGSEPVTGTVH